MRKSMIAILGALAAAIATPAAASDPPGAGFDVVTTPYVTSDKSTYYLIRYNKTTGKGGVWDDEQYDWGAGWDAVVPFKAWSEYILFYDRQRGRGEIRKIIRSGGPTGRTGGVSGVVHTYTGWRKSWDIVTRIGNRCIFFYSKNGSANIYFTDKKTGGIGKRVFSTNKWTKNWSHIIDVPGGVLFYKQSTGGARIYKMKGGCKMGKTTFKTKSWRKSWAQILPIRGSKGIADGKPGLLFFDKKKGEGYVYRYNIKKGKLGKQLKGYKSWLKRWDQIMFRAGAKGRNSVMFYDKQRGSFNHYFLQHNATLGKRIK